MPEGCQKKNYVVDWLPMKEVVIYSTPTCHFCQLAKEFFKEHSIAYTEHDVATDAQKRNEMVELTGQFNVPVIKIDDKVFVGFQEEKFREVFEL